MQKVPVSVVLPVRNRAHLIEESIRSILGQTWTDFELVVVDDASEDGTGQILLRLAEEDARIHVVRRPERGGAGGARNDGITAARGEWIAFQDSDDRWHPDKLEKQLAFAEAAAPDTVAVYTSYWRNEDDRRERMPRVPGNPNGLLLERLALGNFITTQTLMARRAVLQELGGFDSRMRALEDWELCLRLAAQGRMLHLDEPLVDYHLQADSLTASRELFVESYEYIMDKHREIVCPTARQTAWHWAVMGNQLCRMNSRPQGRAYLWRAWKSAPLNWRVAGAWGLSFLPAPVFRKLTEAYARR